MQKPIIWVVGVLTLVVLCGGFYFLGMKHAEQSMTFRNVSASQLATAMKDDNFYSNFANNTLVVKGQVASVHKSPNSTTISFSTSSSYKTNCILHQGSPAPAVGGTTTILAEGGSGVRQPNGVLLKDCHILKP